MAKTDCQVSPSHTASLPWDIEHLDHEILGGKVKSTQVAHIKLEKHVGLGSFFRFKVQGAIFKVAVAFATQTSKRLQNSVDGSTKEPFFDVPISDKCHPYVIDRMVAFWYTLHLNVGKLKPVRHATVPPHDPALLDATATLTSTDALLQILSAAYELEDQALINASHAAARSLILQGGLGAKECVKFLEQAYTLEGVNQEHEMVRKRLLLTAALRMRSAVQFPGPVKNAMTRALTCEALQEDWIEAEKWMDRKESAK